MEKKKEWMDFFKECVSKDHLFEEDLTLQYMKEALEEYQKKESDLCEANQLVSQYIENLKEVTQKLRIKQRRVKRLLESSEIICQEYDELEKRIEELEFENNQLKEYQAKYLGLCK